MFKVSPIHLDTMKTRFLLFSVLLFSMFAHAQTLEVSGLQSGVWEADTIKVIGDVLIQDSLDILPGTTVIFQDFYNLKVDKGASFRAIGNENDSILFTVADTTGFHIFNSGRGGWNGICMNMAADVKLDYCRLQYGKAAKDDDQDGGALRIRKCDRVEIDHSTLFCNFSREHGGALDAQWSNVSMHDCQVSNNLTYTKLDTVYYMYGGGLRFLNCDVEIMGTTLCHNNGESAIGGALCLDSCSVNIDRCIFEYNYGINGAGLYIVRSWEKSCSISNSLFANNISGHFGGGLAICDSSPVITNLTVVKNHSIGVNCGGIFFYQNSSPILRNCIVYGNTNNVPLEEPIQMWSWTFEDFAPQFYNCLVQFGYENITNHEIINIYENCLDDNPLFVAPDDDDFRLNNNSPCIDAGSPETPQEILDGLDLDGHWRLNGSLVDIGAYEFSGEGCHETTFKDNALQIIGNPITTTSYAVISLEKAGSVEIMVYSMDGKQVLSEKIGCCEAGENHIALGEKFQGFTSGTYLIIVRAAGKALVAKVVK